MSNPETPSPDRRENPFRSPNAMADPPVEGLEEASVRRRRRITLIILAVFLVPIATVLAFACCCIGTMVVLVDDIHRMGKAQNYGFMVGFIGAAVVGGGLILFFARRIRRIG